MAQSTGMLDALTLHSLLGLQGDFCSKDKQDKPLQVDFLIVDEASMVDMWLAHQLFTRLRKGQNSCCWAMLTSWRASARAMCLRS